MCKGKYSCHNNYFRRHASKNILENIEIKHAPSSENQLPVIREHNLEVTKSPKIWSLEPFGGHMKNGVGRSICYPKVGVRTFS